MIIMSIFATKIYNKLNISIMKNKINLKSLLLSMTAIILFSSCSNELDNPNYPMKNKSLDITENIKNDADNMSANVARLHDELLIGFFKEFYKPANEYTNEMHDDLLEYVNSLLEYEEGFESLDIKYEDIMKLHNYDNLLIALMDLPDQEMFESDLIYNNSMKFDSKANDLFDKFAERSEFTIDDLQKEYDEYVKLILNDETNIVNYVASRVYADLYLSSLKTWILYYYSIEHPEKVNSKWPSFSDVKDYVKEGVKLAVPAVKKDVTAGASAAAGVMITSGGTAALAAPVVAHGIVGIAGISSMVTLYNTINGK